MNTRLTRSAAMAVLLAVVCARVAVAANCRLVKSSSIRAGWWDVKVERPAFTSHGPVGKTATRGFHASANCVVKRFLDYARKELKSKPERKWDLDIATRLSIVETTLISGHLEIYEDTAGAHPNMDYRAYTYGVVKGKAKRLRMSDLLAPGVTPKRFAEEVVLPALNKMKSERSSETLEELDTKLLDNFDVTPSGITFLFPAYAVGCYAEGPYFVKLPWSGLKGYIARDGPLGRFCD